MQRSIFWNVIDVGRAANSRAIEVVAHFLNVCSTIYAGNIFSDFTATDSVHTNIQNMLVALFLWKSLH
jgi:hypothetical protein